MHDTQALPTASGISIDSKIRMADRIPFTNLYPSWSRNVTSSLKKDQNEALEPGFWPTIFPIVPAILTSKRFENPNLLQVQYILTEVVRALAKPLRVTYNRPIYAPRIYTRSPRRFGAPGPDSFQPHLSLIYRTT